MVGLSKNNGAVMLGREMRLRISPQHSASLQALAKRHGWDSPTAFAEALLTTAIEERATNTLRAHVLEIVTQAWQRARYG